jgi:hypothetical protein
LFAFYLVSTLEAAFLAYPKATLFCFSCSSSVKGTGATLSADADTAAVATGLLGTAVAFP